MKLIGICGKKGSGKTTLAKDLQKYYRNNAKVTTIMSMAGPLKDFCQDYLGLTYEQLYGTEEQKNSLTNHKWEDLPHYQQIFLKIKFEETIKAEKELEKQPLLCRLYEQIFGYLQYNIQNRIALKLPFGYMTARQVIQEWGTGVFRKVDPRFWVKKAHQIIKEDQSYNNGIRPSDIIIFDDIRFDEECEMIREYEGILIKLMRKDSTQDNHQSENLKYSNYDIIVPDSLGRDETLSYLLKELNGS